MIGKECSIVTIYNEGIMGTIDSIEDKFINVILSGKNAVIMMVLPISTIKSITYLISGEVEAEEKPVIKRQFTIPSKKAKIDNPNDDEWLNKINKKVTENVVVTIQDEPEYNSHALFKKNATDKMLSKQQLEELNDALQNKKFK